MTGKKQVFIHYKDEPASKRGTKKTASKPPVRSVSLKEAKSTAPRKRALCQVVDDVRSFSDEEDYPSYIAPIGEDDDITTASPGVKIRSHEEVFTSQGVDDVSDKLLLKLKGLREQVRNSTISRSCDPLISLVYSLPAGSQGGRSIPTTF